MINFKTISKYFLFTIIFNVISLNNSLATSFVINDGQTVNVTQTLDANNETGVINEGGTLSTGANNAIVINNVNDVQVTNSGTITSTNDGIDERGSNNTIINNGSITANQAINTRGDNITITNNSTLISTGNNGINVNGNNGVITNSGTITSSTNGINLNGDDGVITNSGTVTSDTNGININGDNGIITNSGTITSDNIGININGSSGVITNSGTIRSDNSGININNDNTRVINNGNITVTGANATAINLNNGSILTNNGKITATGNSTQAISGNNNSQTLILGSNSEIIGTIDLEGGNDTVTVLGNNKSSRILFNNVETFNLPSNFSGVLIGNELHMVDPTSAAMFATNINGLTLDINNSINSRINSLNNSQGENTFWVQAFNSDFERGQEQNNLSYNHNRSGIISGYEIKEETSKSGIIFGVARTNSETDRQNSFESDSNSIFTGLYKHFYLNNSFTLSTNLILGYERYETERLVIDNINGEEIAHSDYNNYFISPSLGLNYKYKVTDILELNPNLNINYTNSQTSDQREQGATSSNVNIKSRNIQTLNSRIGLTTIFNLNYYQLRLGAGYSSRFIEEDDVRASISDTDFRYSVYNDRQVNGGYLNFGFDILHVENLAFGVDLEINKADGNEDRRSARINIGYNF